MNEPIAEHAAKLERDAIVAWLHKQEATARLRAEDSKEQWDWGALGAIEGLANAIQRGDHHD
jgi:hypothetical protein